jgi:gamma-glutamylcyclotransferase
MTCLIFAYGSNMCSGRFRDYEMRPVRSGRAALLEGFVLKFNKPSTDGSGKATVFQNPGDLIWGVLYEIPITDLSKLDNGERGYVRESTTVLLENDPVTAWLYIAKRPDAAMRLRPYSWYKRFIVEGAREHTLPSDYIASLEDIEAWVDSDPARHRERMSLVCYRNDADL